MVKSRRYFIVGPSWVGDMIMAQTLFRSLKSVDPGCSIDVLAPAWCRDILLRMPEIDQAISMPIGHGELRLAERWKLGKSLRPKGYDQAIVLPNSFKSALIPFFARIPIRTGWRGEMRYGLLNDIRVLNKEKLPLMIQRFAALAYPKNKSLPDQLPMPALKTNTEELLSTLDKWNLDTDRKILSLCPGAEYGPAKRWPERYFAEIANEKLKEGWQVWIFGSIKDQTVAAEIQKLTHDECLDLTGKTNLGEAIDLLSLSSCVLTNDSGLMHAAAALRKPIVVMYGSSDPGFTPPLTDQVKILSLNLDCSPCFERVCPLKHLDCLEKLHPEKVLNAMRELGE